MQFKNMVNNTGVIFQTLLLLANQKKNNISYSELYNLPPGIDGGDVKDIKCFGVYGCFPISYPWTENRPANQFPESPSQIDVHYPVFNKNSNGFPKFIDINDPEHIKTLGINKKGNIYFIAHGFLESGTKGWLSDMTNALLEFDGNGIDSVILIDWEKGAVPPYTQAVANIRLVGAITSHIIHLLAEEVGINLKKVHMIGHSLGSHIAGYTGFYLQKDFGLKLGRISGLDPARPHFEDTDPIMRLDRTDADFVDIIHTDATPFTVGGLGMSQAIGHIDFYPNSGSKQPGCDYSWNEFMEKEESVYNATKLFLGCSHLRSFQYYTESILSNCSFTGITCDSWASFKAGKCFDCGKNNRNCFQMGFKAINSKHKVKESTAISAFLITNNWDPFCRSHYRITIVVSSSNESIGHGSEVGNFLIRVYSENKLKSDKIRFSNEDQEFRPATNYTSGMISGSNVGPPKKVSIIFDNKSLFNSLFRILSIHKVYIDHIVLESMEYKTKIRLCPESDSYVSSDSTKFFSYENC